jgi:hypothetical protein
MLHTLRFSLQNAVYFIMLLFLVPVLFTFYIQGELKIKCKIPVPKGVDITGENFVYTSIWKLSRYCALSQYLVLKILFHPPQTHIQHFLNPPHNLQYSLDTSRRRLLQKGRETRKLYLVATPVCAERVVNETPPPSNLFFFYVVQKIEKGGHISAKGTHLRPHPQSLRGSTRGWLSSAAKYS